MFRTARTVVGLSVFGGISIAVVVGWVTGFFHKAFGVISGLWTSFLAWLDQPFDTSHLFAGVGAVLIPVAIIFAVLFALTDS